MHGLESAIHLTILVATGTRVEAEPFAGTMRFISVFCREYPDLIVLLVNNYISAHY